MSFAVWIERAVYGGKYHSCIKLEITSLSEHYCRDRSNNNWALPLIVNHKINHC